MKQATQIFSEGEHNFKKKKINAVMGFRKKTSRFYQEGTGKV